MSVDEAVTRSLSEVGVLQIMIDNQQGSFSSGNSSFKSCIFTAIEVSQWTLRKQEKWISPSRGFESLLSLFLPVVILATQAPS